MKLYTEDQIKEVYLQGWYDGKQDIKNKQEDAISFQTPIELPSDEEIEKRFDTNSNRLDSKMYESGFRDGVKWMKEQILNQNK